MARHSRIDQVIQKLSRSLARAFEKAGAREESNIQEMIGTPYPPASSPGTPPHRRTGNLQDGVGHDVRLRGRSVVLTMFSNRAAGDPRVPIYLEYGTGKVAPRPYMIVSKRNMMKQLPAMLAAELRGNK